LKASYRPARSLPTNLSHTELRIPEERAFRYRGASLIRDTPLLGPYSRTIPRDLW